LISSCLDSGKFENVGEFDIQQGKAENAGICQENFNQEDCLLLILCLSMFNDIVVVMVVVQSRIGQKGL